MAIKNSEKEKFMDIIIFNTSKKFRANTLKCWLFCFVNYPAIYCILF